MDDEELERTMVQCEKAQAVEALVGQVVGVRPPGGRLCIIQGLLKRVGGYRDVPTYMVDVATAGSVMVATVVFDVLQVEVVSGGSIYLR